LPTGYFRYGNSARQFDKIRTYAVRRLAILVGKRYQRGRRYGWVHVTQHSPNCPGADQPQWTRHRAARQSAVAQGRAERPR
jgi:hypothetical protein